MSFSIKSSHPFTNTDTAVVEQPQLTRTSTTLFDKNSKSVGYTSQPSVNTQVNAGSETGMAIRTVSDACADFY